MGDTQDRRKASLQRMPANKLGKVAKSPFCDPSSGKDYDYPQMLRYSYGLKESLNGFLITKEDLYLPNGKIWWPSHEPRGQT